MYSAKPVCQASERFLLIFIGSNEAKIFDLGIICMTQKRRSRRSFSFRVQVERQNLSLPVPLQGESLILFNFTGCEGGKCEFMAGLGQGKTNFLKMHVFPLQIWFSLVSPRAVNLWIL